MKQLCSSRALLAPILAFSALASATVILNNGAQCAPVRETATWDKPATSVTLFARLRKPARSPFGAMEPVVVDLSLKNISASPVTFTETFSSTDYEIIARDFRDAQMPVTRYGYKHRKGEVPPSSATRLYTLLPGKTRHFEIVVNRMVDMSVDGNYKVIIRRFIGFRYVQSNALKIDIGTVSS